MLTKLLLPFIIVVISTGCSDNIESVANEITSSAESGDSDDADSWEKVEATIDRVIDGDTIKVEMPDGTDESVRLLLVDTPESVHPDKPKQPYGEKSSDFAKKKFSESDKVKLEYDGPKRGKYDRLLAYVWVNGENFNKTLLKKGLARYAYDYDPPYKYGNQFKKAEKEAEKQNKNIWSIDGFAESGFEDY